METRHPSRVLHPERVQSHVLVVPIGWLAILREGAVHNRGSKVLRQFLQYKRCHPFLRGHNNIVLTITL
eukprot:scaffold49254_cov52-Attheya_sp.AAC.3